jgi:hypothetical protein
MTIYLFWRFDGPSFDGPFKAVTPAVTKEILTCEEQSFSQRLSTLLGYLATGKSFEELKS